METETKTEMLSEQRLVDPTPFKKEILIWQVAVGVGLFALANLWHFLYEWSGWAPLAFIAPANESVFEHLKLTVWPSLIAYGIEYIFLRKKTNNFFVAKAAGMYLNPFVIMFTFYFYTGAFTGAGNNVLAIDIPTVIVAVFVQQFVGYKLLMREPLLKKGQIYLEITAIVLVVVMVVLMGLFAYFPPQLPLFYSNDYGYYGLTP